MVPPSENDEKIEISQPTSTLAYLVEKQNEETSFGDLVLWFLKRWQSNSQTTAPVYQAIV